MSIRDPLVSVTNTDSGHQMCCCGIAQAKNLQQHKAEAEAEAHAVQQSAAAASKKASAGRARLQEVAAEVEAAQARLESLHK
jgi:hypothetical protein